MYGRQIQAYQNDKEMEVKKRLADAQLEKYHRDSQYENVKTLGQNALLKALQGQTLTPQEWAAARLADAQSGGMTYDPVTGAMIQKPSLFEKLNIPADDASGGSMISRRQPVQNTWHLNPKFLDKADPLAGFQETANNGGYSVPPLMPLPHATVQGADNDPIQTDAQGFENSFQRTKTGSVNDVYGATRNAAQGNRRLQQAIDERKAMMDIDNANKPYSTDVQALSAGFADRMKTSQEILASQDVQGTDPLKNTLNNMPLGGYAVGEDYKSYDQSKRDFVNAVLRRESGATIQDEEFQNAEKQYFPQPGDTETIRQQKARARQQAIINMERAAGPNYTEQRAPAPQKKRKPAPAIGTFKNGYTYVGGDPAQPSSWQKANGGQQ